VRVAHPVRSGRRSACGFHIGVASSRSRVAVATVACVVLAMTPALAGHAGGIERLQTCRCSPIRFMSSVQRLAGQPVWLVAVGIPMRPIPGESRAARVALLVRAFSPAALSFAALVTATGVVSAWLRLGTVPALWSTSYGQVLLLKLAVLPASRGRTLQLETVQPALGTRRDGSPGALGDYRVGYRARRRHRNGRVGSDADTGDVVK